MSLSTAPASAPAPRHSIGFNLGAIASLVLLGAVGMAYVVDSLGRASRIAQPGIEDGDTVSQTISGQELAIPASWFRYGEQLKPGFTNQIDLRVTLRPDNGTAMPVDVTLVPRSRARTSASLLDTVYLHQFNDETSQGVMGLIGKPMGKGNGFTGETVWYDALSPNPFVAKCVEPIAPGGPSQCVRTVYLSSGIAATYAFDATALQSWRQFDAGMQRWLARIGAW